MALFCVGFTLFLGLTYLVPIQIGWKTYPHNLGVVSGLIVGGSGFGLIASSKISTWIVNPENQHILTPDSGVPVFSEEVNLRVPLMFQGLCCYYLLLILTSLLLIKDVPSQPAAASYEVQSEGDDQDY